jgi:RNA polymerase sigma-70 factor (ECF subfamily)
LTDEWDEKKAIIQAQKDLIHFGPIFEHYFEKVFAFVFSRTNNRSIAEDLTSQIFIKILQAIPRYRHKGSFAAWVFTIARNTLNSFFRSAAYRLNENLDDRQMSEYHKQTSPHQNYKAIENTIDLEKAIQGLTDNDRELLSLRYAAELSYKDIGKIVKKKQGAVKMAIHRILCKVRERMER